MGSQSLDIVFARDISTSGVGVFIGHRFEGCDVDGALELVITLPGQRPFQALGVIRHVTARAPEEYFGLEFTRISERALEGIEAYVTARLRVPRSAG